MMKKMSLFVLVGLFCAVGAHAQLGPRLTAVAFTPKVTPLTFKELSQLKLNETDQKKNTAFGESGYDSSELSAYIGGTGFNTSEQSGLQTRPLLKLEYYYEGDEVIFQVGAEHCFNGTDIHSNLGTNNGQQSNIYFGGYVDLNWTPLANRWVTGFSTTLGDGKKHLVIIASPISFGKVLAQPKLPETIATDLSSASRPKYTYFKDQVSIQPYAWQPELRLKGSYESEDGQTILTADLRGNLIFGSSDEYVDSVEKRQTIWTDHTGGYSGTCSLGIQQHLANGLYVGLNVAESYIKNSYEIEFVQADQWLAKQAISVSQEKELTGVSLFLVKRF